MPLVLMLIGVRPTVNESRAPTELPPFTRTSVTRYFTERLPLRDVAIEADRSIDNALTFGDGSRTGNESVVAGADGWLFFRDSLRRDCPAQPPDNFFELADAFRAKASAKQVQMIFVAAPDKAQVYADQLAPSGIAGVLGLKQHAGSCSDSWLGEIERQAAQHSWLLPLAGPVQDVRSGSDEIAYYRSDTHWTDAGSMAMVQAVVNAFDPLLWKEVKVTSPRLARTGTIYFSCSVNRNSQTI